MAIKVGDIVRYNDKEQRVMSVISWAGDIMFRLSREDKSNRIRTSEVTLIESFIKPNIKTGDLVRILPTPPEEQYFFIDANKPIDDDIYEVVDIQESDRCGMVVDIMYKGHKRHYMAHYVKKISDYDMI